MPSRIVAVLALLVGSVAVLVAQSTREGYQTLSKEYEDALEEYQKAFKAARTDAERQTVLREKHPRIGDYATKFMALARRNPDTTEAVEALVWIVNHPLPPSSAESLLRGKAMEILAKDHADEDKVGSLCTGLVRGIDTTTDTFLRGVRSKAKKAPVKARASSSLALNLRHRARLLAVLGKDKEARKQYEAALGKDVVTALLEQDSKKLLAECEKLFEEVRDRYGDVEHPIHGTFEPFARRHLLAMRKPVTAGKESPPIVGEDIDGKKMQLSQHKGKVVLLDFWSHAFGPCRSMYEYERGLVARMDGKPFVLLGINGDHDREALKKAVKKEKITWRSFYDAGTTGGPIATRWDVEVWPTVVLIDHAGVVRHLFAGSPDPKTLDKLIDELVREAGK